LRILRLDLGTIHVTHDPWPVHGFALLHESLGVVLVDTGCGGPEELLREYRVVNRAIADALAAHDLAPSDVTLVINTHLHFDHCGQNPAFQSARFLVQRAEHERVRAEGGPVWQWLQSSGVTFELLDGDTMLADDLQLIATRGHTVGHQSVLATTADGGELFVGDAAFRHEIWHDPSTHPLPPGQADDEPAFRESLQRLRELHPSRVHFCHDD
jgi:glyoxylase-like metal-dependent hydrolase (beta-lactamase superfamily II)